MKAGLVRWLFCAAALVGGASSAFSEEPDPPADTVVLTVGAFEGGRLEVNGVPRQPGDTVSVPHGTTVTLVATPGDGFAFMGWSGDLTPAEAQEPTLTVTMDAARRVAPVFCPATDDPVVNAGDDLLAALAAAKAGGRTTLIVRPGEYSVSASLVLDWGVRLWGVCGPEVTKVVHAKTTVADGDRIAHLSAAGASVSGLTLVSSATAYNKGGKALGVYVTAAATVTNCVIRSTSSACIGTQNSEWNGGGLYLDHDEALAVDTKVTGFRVCNGAGAYVRKGRLLRCEIVGNQGGNPANHWSKGWGSGLNLASATAVAEHCRIHGNVSHASAGAVYMTAGRLADCDIYSNRHARADILQPSMGANVIGGEMIRCRLVGNLAADGRESEIYDSTFAGTFTDNELAQYIRGTGNVPRAPLLTDSFRATALDLAPGGETTLTADVADATSYAWDFGDGSPQAAGRSVTHAYAEKGSYTVTLAYVRGGETVTRVRTGFIRVYGETVCLAADGAGVFPYDTPETAATNFLDAVEAAVAASGVRDATVTLRIGAGTFEVNSQGLLLNRVRVVGAGPEATELVANGRFHRCFGLVSDGCSVESLTIRKFGYLTVHFAPNNYGGSVYLSSDSLVTNCVVTDGFGGGQNWQSFGGELYASKGRIVDSVFRNSSCDGYGGAALLTGTATMDRCVITNCTGAARYSGSPGLALRLEGDALVRNTLIARNTSSYHNGAGLCLYSTGARAENCTIVDNAVKAGGLVGAGAYVHLGTLVNAIVRRNRLADSASDVARRDSASAVVSYTCSSETVPGEGNTTEMPEFVDADGGDWRLAFGSAGIDAGLGGVGGELDLDRRARVVDGRATGTPRVDLGAYEFAFGGSGLAALFDVSGAAVGVDRLEASFAARVFLDGAVLDDLSGCTFTWDFGDGTTVTGSGAAYASVTHEYVGGQRRSVTLTVTRGEMTSEPYVRADCISVCSSRVHVAQDGSATFPYDTPARATASLKDAVDALALAVASGAAHVTLAIGEGTFRSDVGLAFPFPCAIVGAAPERTVLSSGVKGGALVSLTADGSVLSGVTLRDAEALDARGGAVSMTSRSTITNCVFTKNMAGAHGLYGWGGSLYATAGQVVACAFVGNDTHKYNQTVCLSGPVLMDRCVITNNYGGHKYHTHGGVGLRVEGNGGAVVRNCLIAGNRSEDLPGAGVHTEAPCRFENCTIVDNTVLGILDEPAYSGLPAGVYAIGLRPEMVNCIVNFNTHKGDVVNVDSGAVSATWCVAPELAAGEGNLATDAAFRDRANGDYRLTSAFTRCSKGKVLDWMRTAFDLDGRPRLRGRFADRGCYVGTPYGFLLQIR